MAENILITANQVVILFVLVAIGYMCGRLGLIKKEAVGSIIDVVLYVVSPCVIIVSFMREFETELLVGLLQTFAAAAAAHIIGILAARLLIHDKEKERECVMRFAAVFSNCGYMSLPLQNALLGTEGMFYGAAFIAVFNVFVWTYGVLLMSGDRKSVSIKKLAATPALIAVAVGAVIFVCSITLPNVIFEPMNYLAALNTPLPMMIIGYNLANAPKGSISKIASRGAVMCIIARLLVIPAVFAVLMYACGLRGAVLTSCAIAASAPSAANTNMFAVKYGKSSSVSAQLVSVTTMLSVLTMPVIVGIVRTFA